MPPTTDGELNDITEESDLRWAYLASIVTAFVLIGFMVIVGLGAAGILNLALVPQSWFILTVTVVLMAAAWLWGTDTLKAVRSSKKSNTEQE